MSRIKKYLGVVILICLCSCHSNESNYRQAYDIAVQSEGAGLDSIVYSKIKEEAKPKIKVVNGDSIRTRTEILSVVGEDNLSVRQLQEFNVVVGQYKMLFNAKSHCNRLREMSYDAFLLQTMEAVYYVAIGATDTLQDAALLVKQYKKECSGQYVGLDEPIVLIIPKIVR